MDFRVMVGVVGGDVGVCESLKDVCKNLPVNADPFLGSGYLLLDNCILDCKKDKMPIN